MPKITGAILTQDEICKLFRVYVKTNWKFQRQAADFFEVGDYFLSKAMTGLAIPNRKMLEAIGYKRERVFIPTREDHFQLPATTQPLWHDITCQVIEAVESLESQGVDVFGYYAEKGKPPIISVAPSEATDALGGRMMHRTLTQDGTLQESHYVAHVHGCLVRWSEIKEAKEGRTIAAQG